MSKQTMDTLMNATPLKIVAMGGGEIRTGETLPIDREIVAFTGKGQPRALFIPTASDDSVSYCGIFRKIYGEQLGCDTDVLWQIKNPHESIAAAEKIDRTDLIYVGGGNTRSMLEVWRRLGTDQLLVAAGKQGKVLCGVSAGALCWFRYGNSDAPIIEGRTDSKTVRIDGLGLVDAALCPHMVSEPYRSNEFSKMMASTPAIGIGLDDNCALQVLGDSYRLVCWGNAGRAHRYVRTGSSIRIDLLHPSGYQPLSELLRGKS
jgi:dipeptidase E